ERGSRRHVVDSDRGQVVGEAAILVEDARSYRARAGAVIQEGRGHRGRGRDAGPGVGAVADLEGVVIVEVVGVAEAGGGVGRGRVELVGEAHRGRRAFIHRAVVA